MPNRPQFPLTRPLPPLIFTQNPASLYFHTENILPHLTSARNKPWPSSLSFKILTPLHLHIPHPAPPHARSTPWLTSLPNTTPWPSHFLLTTWPHFTSTYHTPTHLTSIHHIDPTSLPHKNRWLNSLFSHTLIHLTFIYQPQATFIQMHGYFVSLLTKLRSDMPMTLSRALTYARNIGVFLS